MVIMAQQSSGGRRRVCNGSCHHAKKPACLCICGGKFHGVSWRIGHDPTSIEDALESPPLPSEAALNTIAKAVGV